MTALARKEVAARQLPQRERAYGEIKRRILDNELPPGTQMLEVEVAELLGMSRTPVREALIRLADEGLIEVRPRHGMRVRPLSPGDMAEIYDILTSLESTAAGLLARRGLSPEQDAELAGAIADMEAALARDDLLAWAEADERFHRGLVDFCGNGRIRDILGQVWEQQHRARIATLRLRPRPVQSNRDHAAVLAAIRRGDAAEAERVHHAHRRSSGDMLVGLLRAHGLGNL